MARIAGNWGAVSLGTIWQTNIRETDSVSVVSFVAGPHASDTDPCFRVTLPGLFGQIQRISVWPVDGYTPTATFDLTIRDAFGAEFSFTDIATAGSSDLVGSTSILLAGAPTIDIDDLHSGRVIVAVYVTDRKNASTDLSFSRLTIGSTTDYIDFDPTTGSYDLAGAARPTARHLLYVQALATGTLGTTTNSDVTTAGTVLFLGAYVTNANDGGIKCLATRIPDWADCTEDATVIVPIQAMAAAAGNVVLQTFWAMASDGDTGLTNSNSAISTFAGPTTDQEIMYATAGTIPKTTFDNGDIAVFGVQRMAATEAADTYNQSLRFSRVFWIEWERKSL